MPTKAELIEHIEDLASIVEANEKEMEELRRENGRQKQALANCHQEIFKLRDTLTAHSVNTVAL